MSNRSFTFALLLCAIAASGSAWAAGPQRGLVPGFLDAKSGTFVTSATLPAASDVEPLAQATYGGTLALKINITLKTGFPTSWPIHCSQVATVIDVGGLSYTNSKGVLATRNGSTATCQININYAWLLNGSGGSVSTYYMVTTIGESTSLEQIDATGTLAPITIPANGATTSRTVAVTL